MILVLLLDWGGEDVDSGLLSKLEKCLNNKLFKVTSLKQHDNISAAASTDQAVGALPPIWL